MPKLNGQKVAPWIQTFMGRKFDFENMGDNVFDPLEIAVVLSRTRRFTSHTKWPYSVAQHSVLVARQISSAAPRLRLIALLHDAAETITGDNSSPLKFWLRDYGRTTALDELEDRIWAWIAEYHKVDRDERDLVKIHDLAALATEARDLMLPPPMPWIKLPPVWNQRIEPWHEEYARDEWLHMYHGIMGTCANYQWCPK